MSKRSAPGMPSLRAPLAAGLALALMLSFSHGGTARYGYPSSTPPPITLPQGHAPRPNDRESRGAVIAATSTIFPDTTDSRPAPADRRITGRRCSRVTTSTSGPNIAILPAHFHHQRRRCRQHDHRRGPLDRLDMATVTAPLTPPHSQPHNLTIRNGQLPARPTAAHYCCHGRHRQPHERSVSESVFPQRRRTRAWQRYAQQ
jgi:hypothetical protein